MAHLGAVIDARDFGSQGWAFVSDKAGKAIAAVADLAVGGSVRLRFTDGEAATTVNELQRQESRTSKSEESKQPEEITCDAGYQEFKDVVERLKHEGVPVDEMFEKFRRGKGLEAALRTYLTEREGELTEIEQGKSVFP